MGAVYEGENLRIHRRVAIKVLHSGVAENADAVQRFEREAQAAGRIGSEHIVEVLDLGNLPDGDRFMVMEFMDGDSLSGRIQSRGRLTAKQTFPIARQILEALAAAHGAGIIHRDLKPDNVFLLKSRGGHTDFVKLLDFGISKFSALSGESGFSMTRTGSVMGTPYYMSPEQAKGAKGMDHRADLYAVGVILYECVTGRVPFNADTFNELLFKIVLETPQPVEQVVPDSDPEFNKLIQRGMAREPGLRFQTAREFQAALDAWAAGQPVQGPALGTTPGPVAPGMSVLSSGSMGRVTPAAISSSVLGSGPLPQSGTMSAVGPAPAGTPPMRTGTPGTWANNTGPSPFTAEPKKSSTPLIAAATIGVLLLAGGGVAALKMKGGDEPAQPPVAAQPPGPTPEQLAEEAKRVAELAAREKDVEEKIKRAEEEARAAEERAKKAEANSKEQAEAEEARERLKTLKAAAPATAKSAAVKAAPAAPSHAPVQKPPEPAHDPQPGGRKIRTEL